MLIRNPARMSIVRGGHRTLRQVRSLQLGRLNIPRDGNTVSNVAHVRKYRLINVLVNVTYAAIAEYELGDACMIAGRTLVMDSLVDP